MSTRARREPARDGLFIVGLVGQTGSGKSTVAQVLAMAGAMVLDADAIGHEVTDTVPEVRAALIAEYGSEVYGPDGKLDRRRVAARVFTDPEARRRLDQLVHPRIIERIREQIGRRVMSGWKGVVVIDAALLLDWGFERDCDAVVAVIARPPDQVARLATARGWSEEEARRRLAVQRSPAEFRQAADATIDNLGDREALAEDAIATVSKLARAAAARDGSAPRC